MDKLCRNKDDAKMHWYKLTLIIGDSNIESVANDGELSVKSLDV